MDYTQKLYTPEVIFIKTDYPSLGFTGIVEYVGLPKYWQLNGKLHNELRPAQEWSVTKKFYINGDYINCTTTQQLKFLVDIMKLKGLL